MSHVILLLVMFPILLVGLAFTGWSLLVVCDNVRGLPNTGMYVLTAGPLYTQAYFMGTMQPWACLGMLAVIIAINYAIRHFSGRTPGDREEKE